jgi:DDE_Tnp_1-associated
LRIEGFGERFLRQEARMQLFREAIGSVSDPRASNAHYRLSDVLFIAVVAVLCGVAGCTGFAAFARLRRDYLSRFMLLPERLPSHDVFSDILAALDQKTLAVAEAKGSCNPFEQRQSAHGRMETRQAFVLPCKTPRNTRGSEPLVGMKAIGVMRRIRSRSNLRSRSRRRRGPSPVRDKLLYPLVHPGC